MIMKPRSLGLTTLSLAFIMLTLTFTSGCAKTVTAPVPGQISTTDAFFYRVLLDTQAALNAFKADLASGKVTETPTIRIYLNTAINDYDIAEAAYQAWRTTSATNPTASSAAVSTAVTKVQTDITNLGAAISITTPTTAPAAKGVAK